MTKWLAKLDTTLSRHIDLLIAGLALILLRIPNWFEPYWYGDEAIYLTIGNGLRQGKLLYADIVDHKTPLIYYLAMTPDQVWFKLILAVANIISLVAIYAILQKWIKERWLRWIGLAVFTWLTAVPWLEGHIANAELLLMAPILVALAILVHNKLSSWRASAAAGALVGLAILLKVPAIFDGAAVAAWLWFSAWRQVRPQPHFTIKGYGQRWLNVLAQVWRPAIVFAAAMLAVIICSVIYYYLRGSSTDYLNFGLLYNFKYAASWQPDVQNWLAKLFIPLSGKIIFLFLFVAVLQVGINYLSTPQQVVLLWLGLALVGANLSNRPYPHYLQQLVPAFSLWVVLYASAISNLLHHLTTKGIFSAKTKSDFNILSTTIWLIFSGATVGFCALVITQLNFSAYPIKDYYQNWWQLVTKQQDWHSYANKFNYLMADNYAAAKIIATNQPEQIFIWGTNPMLYALTNTSPTGKFTVAFHIHDLQAYAETLQAAIAKEPKFVVVMKKESPLPGLDDWLITNYTLHTEFDNFYLYKKLPSGN